MDLRAVEQLLNRDIGLDASSVGALALRQAVQERMRACAVPDFDDYLPRLHESAAERQQLIECVVVPETWFFRDAEAFAALARLAQGEWLGRAGLRLLSLPCSSGEEPYSMAMALLDAGVAPGRLCIDAVDVSERALARARAAVYGRNSFRGADLAFRERHFETLAQGYRPSELVRATVRFNRCNLFAPELAAAEPYDAVFCRNVLIYFDAAAQARAVAVLARLLKPGGVLFVAPAETAILRGGGFAALPWPRAFAFRRTAAARQQPAAAARATPARPAPRPRPALAPAAQPLAAAAPEPPGLAAISGLADLGRLEEAAHAARQYLERHGPDAQAFHLLGVIEDAQGRAAEAAQHYRRVLYLDPTHREALSHLAVLLERGGEADAAQRMRSRIRRLEQGLGS